MDEESIISITDALFEDACSRGASDIHLDPTFDSISVSYRIDGLLLEQQCVSKTRHSELIARLKILSGLRTDEHFIPQDGRFTIVTRTSGQIDARISVAPTYHGENAVIRLLTPHSEETTLELLGFDFEDIQILSDSLIRSDGMILVTGPTGSGKTTTLYSLIRLLSARPISLVTIEDPVEYSMHGVTQIQVSQYVQLSFSQGLRAVLRQDPDVLMVGEIRDIETAGLAVNAALTGHLVLSSLHTNDAAGALPRLLDMRVEPYLIAATVRLIVAQRLVRKNCTRCIEEYELTNAQKDEFIRHFSSPIQTPEKLYKGVGCAECDGTGYKGRIGIFELIRLTTPLQDAIIERAPASKIRSLASTLGMQTLEVDGLKKVLSGITTLEEVLRVHHA